jgi:hypothetical protein
MTIFKSRTFWTLVAGFVINVYQAFSTQLPPALVGIADAVVLVLGTYFHVNPSTTYNLPSDGSSIKTPQA